MYNTRDKDPSLVSNPHTTDVLERSLLYWDKTF